MGDKGVWCKRLSRDSVLNIRLDDDDDDDDDDILYVQSKMDAEN